GEVVERGENVGGEGGGLEREPDADDNEHSDPDQENAVGAVLHEAKIDLTSQFRRQLQRLALRSDQDRERRHKNEDQADRQQNLIQLAGTVKPAVERLFQDHTQGNTSDKDKRERDWKTEIRAAHRQQDDVAAEHRKRAVGKVDKSHQPHGDRQSDRDNEKHGPGCEPA